MSNCSLCGSGEAWSLPWSADPVVQQWRIAHGDSREYDWRLCRRCGNAFPSFQPDLALLSFFWNRDRQDAGTPGGSDDAIWDRRKQATRKQAARSFGVFAGLCGGAPPRRLLDIACGLGETVKYFADRGWDAFGIDADPALLRFHKEIGIRTEIVQIENAKIEGTFDIILIAHAIYFITQPRSFLESLKPRLNAGGSLCIVLADFMASDDRGLPGYAHSFFPTAGSMRHLLALAGYETILTRTISGSIYLAARPASVALPRVNPRLIRLGYQTKGLRYALFGRPHLALRQWAKAVLSWIR